jgi:NAD(P)-dependent dehydrogenase (short-subunit alcohol dehydrogenase family)
MKLEGRVAIVTGAARGIGRASAMQFAKEGAKVTVADIRERQTRVPLGRFLSPEDVARAALYLVSDDSDGITGIAHLVDGGMLAAAEYSSTWLPKQGH